MGKMQTPEEPNDLDATSSTQSALLASLWALTGNPFSEKHKSVKKDGWELVEIVVFA